MSFNKHSLDQHKATFYAQESYHDVFASAGGLGHRHFKVLDILARFCAKPQRILDIGCGDGSFTCSLKERLGASEIYGVEISHQQAERARVKGITVVEQDLDLGSIPFEENMFDAIFIGDVIEHLYDTDHLLDEIYRFLSPQGICILTTPNLAGLANRVALLFGYQPFTMGTSLIYDTGKFRLSNALVCGGHIRSFTYRAITELVRLHKLELVKCVGGAVGFAGGWRTYNEGWKVV
jgi:methionine biosynthesis protein MetW